LLSFYHAYMPHHEKLLTAPSLAVCALYDRAGGNGFRYSYNQLSPFCRLAHRQNRKEVPILRACTSTLVSALHIQNRLLASLSPADLKHLRPNLREVPIEQGEMLEEPGHSLDAVYFPQSGLISLIVQMPEDSTVEVGTVGSEGAIGMAVGLGSRVSFICALVQVSGTALCVPASAFRGAASQNARIRDLIVRYSELQLGQIQQTAACNALHHVSGRLCRWLLQTSDKIDSDTIPFTHEFLSKMLGVRRSTVSQIASALQAAGIIHTHRGKIKLLKRQALKKRTCECYEIVRQHIDRLVPKTSKDKHNSFAANRREKEGAALTSSFRTE
jgi:CRP-like cAMP-binding protein